MPVSLVHLLPNFYYGGLLVLMGSEIIFSWLFLTYWRITKAEFVLSWLTFLSVIGLCAILPVQVCLETRAQRSAFRTSLLHCHVALICPGFVHMAITLH